MRGPTWSRSSSPSPRGSASASWPAGMINAVRSELLKMRSMPGIWVCFGLAFPLTALFVWAVFARRAATRATPIRSCTRSTTAPAPRRRLLRHHVPRPGARRHLHHQRVPAQDHHVHPRPHPRRGRVLGAKVVVMAWWCVLMAVLSLVIVAAVGLPWNAALGGVTSQVTDQLGAVVPGLVAATVLLGLFGLGFGTLVKNQVAGILLTIGGTFILEPLLVLLARGVFHYDLNWLPSAPPQRWPASLARGSAVRPRRHVTHLSGVVAGRADHAGLGADPARLSATSRRFRRDVT